MRKEEIATFLNNAEDWWKDLPYSSQEVVSNVLHCPNNFKAMVDLIYVATPQKVPLTL